MAEELSTLHTHGVIDDDPHFAIDGNTREIILTSDTNPILIQNDHDSERFTFEVPRLIDGHDLTMCNQVEVHFSNVDMSLLKTTKDGQIDEEYFRLNWKRIITTSIGSVSSSRYDVDDLSPKADDPDTLTFTWLIDGKGATYAGPLIFSIRFRCTADVDETNDGQTVTETYDVYRWNTKPYIGVNVSDGLDTQQAMRDEYSDIIDEWQTAIDIYGDSSVTKVRNESAKSISDIISAETSAKENLTAHVEQLVSDSRKELAASALDAKEILVQSPGYNEDRIMSQKATTDHVQKMVAANNQTIGDIHKDLTAKYGALEDDLLKLHEYVKFAQVDYRNSARFDELLRSYYFKPYRGGSSPQSGWGHTKVRLSCTASCVMLDSKGNRISDVLDLDDRIIDITDELGYDEYRQYQKIRMSDNRIDDVTYSPSCLRRVTVSTGEWFDYNNDPVNVTDGVADGVPYFVEKDISKPGEDLLYDDIKPGDLTKAGYCKVYSSGSPSVVVKWPLYKYKNPLFNTYHYYIFEGYREQAVAAVNAGKYSSYTGALYIVDTPDPEYSMPTLNVNATFLYTYNDVGCEYKYTTVVHVDELIADHPDFAFEIIEGMPHITYGSPAVIVDAIDSAYVAAYEIDEPHNDAPQITIHANGIASVQHTDTSEDGLVDWYTIYFDKPLTNGNSTFAFPVTNGRAIETVEYASTNNDEDTYEIRFNDGTKQTFTVPNVEANRAYLEGNVDDVHTTLNKAGVTSVEHVSEVTSLVDIPEKTTKFARLNSFGGMSNKFVVPTAQGYNLLPFPYAGNNFGSDGAGYISKSVNAVYFIDSANKWTAPDHGYYRFTLGNECLGQLVVNGIRKSDGSTFSYSTTTDEEYFYNTTYDVYLNAGDEIISFGWGATYQSNIGGPFKPAIYRGYVDPEYDELYFVGDDEWVPRVVQYRFANTKLQAIKSVDSNDKVVHTYTIPSDIPTPDGFEDVAGNEHVDTVDVSTQKQSRKVGVLRCAGTENWRDYVGGTNTRPSGVYVYALNLADKEPGLTNMACTIGEYKPYAYDYGDDGNFCGHQSLNTVYFATSKYATLAEWKAHLSSLKASGTPLTLYYELKEPVTEPLPTRLDRLIPVEPNGHLIAVTETRDAVTNAVISTGDAVPLDVEITVINDAGFSEALDRIIEIQNAIIGGGA